jgi:hypothetical protein
MPAVPLSLSGGPRGGHHAKALTDSGLDTCFANPGTLEMQLVY